MHRPALGTDAEGAKCPIHSRPMPCVTCAEKAAWRVLQHGKITKGPGELSTPEASHTNGGSYESKVYLR